MFHMPTEYDPMLPVNLSTIIPGQYRKIFNTFFVNMRLAQVS